MNKLKNFNDMALVKDDNLTRLQWRLGEVIEVYKKRDGIIHSAEETLQETVHLFRFLKVFLHGQQSFSQLTDFADNEEYY